MKYWLGIITWILLLAILLVKIELNKRLIVPEGYRVVVLENDRQWSVYKSEGVIMDSNGYIYEDAKIMFSFAPTPKKIEEAK